MTAFERIVDKLRDEGRVVKERGTEQAVAQCPAHDDNSPSLSLRATETKVLVHCHAGCETEDVLSALGLVTVDLFNEPRTRYDYADPFGTVVRSVARTYDSTGKKKTFRPAGGDVKKAILYRLPQVVEAVQAGTTIYLVEGEEDVHALEAVGLIATSGPQGANSIGKVDFAPLKDAVVVAVVDNDESGQKWATTVREKLEGKAKSLTFVQAKTGKDAADHVAAENDVEDFVELEVEEDVPLRRARITWASQIEAEPVVWAWETNGAGRIPSGSLSVAAGREGTGKSSFGIWLASHITRGTLPGKFEGRALPVLYVAVEDSWRYTLVPRLKAAGADLSKIGRFDVVTDTDEEITLSLPTDNAMLEREIAHHGVALVVLDPIMSLISERLDSHRTREVRVALDPLAKIADRTGAILLGIAHFNKASGTDAASLLSGSHAFRDVPRTIFGFARDESDESGSRVMSQVKNSLGRDDLPSLSYVIESAEVETRKGIAFTGKFAFTGESDRSVAEILRDSRRDPDDVEEAKDAAGWIHGYLEDAGGEAPAKDVLAAGKAVGHSERTLKNARKKVADTSRDGFGKDGVWTWVLRIGPAIGPIGTTDQRPGPMGPMTVPMGASETGGSSEEGGLPGVTGGSTEDEDPPAPQGHHDTGGDQRPPCPTCNRAMGRDDAQVGQCIQCRRIATATEKARKSA